MSSTMQNPKIRFQASARDGSVEYAELLTILCKSAAMPGPFTTSVYGIAGRSEPILDVQICILHIIQPPSIDQQAFGQISRYNAIPAFCDVLTPSF